MHFENSTFVACVLALVLGSTSAACTPSRAYAGEARPAGETALLVGMSPYDPLNLFTTTKVVSVDGEPVEGGARIELLPGKHTLEIYANTDAGKGTRTVEVELEAGMRYLLAAAVDPETLVVVVPHRER